MNATNVKNERALVAQAMLDAAHLSNNWVTLEKICEVRDFVLEHYDAFSNVFPKAFLPTKDALVGETYRRVVVNMLRRCAKVSDAAIIRRKTQKWENGGNLTRYTYRLLTA
jgi:hypothetical protein